MAEQLTAQQRAQLFAMSTRQNYQMLAKQVANTVPQQLQFNLPKARLLSGLYVHLKATFGEDISAKVTPDKVANIIRRISLDLNNGFAPFVVSGEQLRMYNVIDLYAKNMKENLFAKVDGTKAELKMFLPCTTNPRDPIGLILLQNDQTNVTLSIDLGLGTEIGATADPTKVEVNVMAETFSIPANANAYPDLSVLKMVNGRKDSLATEGQQVIKLTTGQIYRKLLFMVVDEDGTPMTTDDITSNIELVFNQADINYSISAEMLRFVNEKQFGTALPDGMYAFDFSSGGGLTNLGGTRDYIDSANLTEFWLRFTTTKRGKVVLVSETIARLQ